MINFLKNLFLFISICISSLTLSSCQLLPFLGVRVVDRVIDRAIDCTIGECNTNKNNTQKANNKPEETINQYYQLINKREYAKAWAFLTPRFQRLKPDNNYQNYEAWWEKVDSVIVDLDSLKLIEKKDDEAIVDVQLRYILKDGRRLDDPSRFTLVSHSNNSHQQWLIDQKIKL
ncbi:hypothetical protein [Calothrix sp. NIES-3974]|uniref:hypothetical protein n=1 Tax=Calothrix sp. NIES-3974 TaxID=2005462 RepID=UPI000B5DF478|nr:hypothetical protein [Calothrix sp. NIES-3974]BAZ04213.1 serine/threonine protein kinase [Calothrix sp. NIES-3974]